MLFVYLDILVITHIMLNKISDSDSDSKINCNNLKQISNIYTVSYIAIEQDHDLRHNVVQMPITK